MIPVRLKPMKRFYFVETKRTQRKYGGQNVRVSVYRHQRDGMFILGELEWCTASYRGPESEVFNWLVENKHIPKSALKWSEKLPSCSGGYYRWQFRDEKGLLIAELGA